MLEGDCQDYEAVPGHGLKCSVSGMERYTSKTEWRYSTVFCRSECVTAPGVDLMVRDIEMGAGTRTYQVREGRGVRVGGLTLACMVCRVPGGGRERGGREGGRVDLVVGGWH